MYWINSEKEGFNPKTNEKVVTTRRELHTDFELPMREDYNRFIMELIEKNAKNEEFSGFDRKF